MGHDHRSGLGRSCRRSIFIGTRRIAIHKFSVPKIFDSYSIPPPRACPSFGFWAHVASNQFLYESTETPSKTCRSRKFLIANPCRRHGHAHRSGLGRSCTRSVFIGTNRIAIQKFSAPKIFHSKSMPPPWAWPSFGLGPILQAISSYRKQQNRHPKHFATENF